MKSTQAKATRDKGKREVWRYNIDYDDLFNFGSDMEPIEVE